MVRGHAVRAAPTQSSREARLAAAHQERECRAGHFLSAAGALRLGRRRAGRAAGDRAARRARPGADAVFQGRCGARARRARSCRRPTGRLGRARLSADTRGDRRRPAPALDARRSPGVAAAGHRRGRRPAAGAPFPPPQPDHLRLRLGRAGGRGRLALGLAHHRPFRPRTGPRGLRRAGLAARPALPRHQRPDPARRRLDRDGRGHPGADRGAAETGPRGPKGPCPGRSGTGPCRGGGGGRRPPPRPRAAVALAGAGRRADPRVSINSGTYAECFTRARARRPARTATGELGSLALTTLGNYLSPAQLTSNDMNVVIVESPAKAKTINKYLGKGFKVLASYGHVRDLPAKDGSVRPDEHFAMSWTVDGKAEKRLKDITDAVRGAEHLYLATDPDREGEAISWHVREVLKNRKALKGVDVKRVVFNEVTKSAVLEAFRHPRELNRELVDAYLARRALDYLVGFTLSPVLWRKLPGSRSAGRVQSVALRLICERESEIEVFKPREYWTIEVEFATPSGERFTARLTHLDGKRLDKFDIADEATARAAAERILRDQNYVVAAVEKKQIRRNPPAPFTTSTLQQEASRKLGFGASRTMRTAQRLYEGVDIAGETVGLITYMRTDGVTMSSEAIAAARSLIV